MRSRLAILGMVIVLVVVSGFVLWTSVYNSRVTDRVVNANRLSGEWQTAARAVASEESLERKYRLEPGSAVLAGFSAASEELENALRRVQLDGDSSDRADATAVLATHRPYLDAIERMFAAVDRGDTAAVLAIDADEVDPKFAAIETTTDAEAQQHDQLSSRQLESLGRIQRFTSTMTPIVFGVGLLVVIAFGSILGRVSGQLASQRRRALRHSMHDPLTGLPNRLLFAEQVEQALEIWRPGAHPAGVLLIDLDRFREVNDTLGHGVGDALLGMIGPRLATVLDDDDTVARLGGDEFAVLLRDIEGIAGAMLIAERINRALSAPFFVDGIDLAVEASIGVVVAGVHGEDAATLFQHADVAMYVAKDQGIGIFAYRPDLDLHSPERLSLLGELRRAPDGDELVVHYQPQISLTTGEFCGAEALVRWHHPTRGLINPDEFIPLSEHTALINPLTRRMLDLTLEQSRSWLDLGHRMSLSVNVSARNLTDDRFIDDVIDLLERHHVAADQLCLEVTESAMMIEPIAARRALRRAHDHGIHIAIDDFGKGFTSLSQLKDLPVTELKIDASFVTSMDVDNGAALIVRSVIDLGHNLGLTVIAEGVETDRVLGMLTGAGCDVAQGYWFARPLTPEALIDFYVTHHTPLGVHKTP